MFVCKVQMSESPAKRSRTSAKSSSRSKENYVWSIVSHSLNSGGKRHWLDACLKPDPNIEYGPGSNRSLPHRSWPS